MAAQWSELRRDLLELILKKLDLADHARFASVCPWWRSVAVENPPISKPLYSVLSHDPDRLLRRLITSLIPSWSKARFVGAAMDGWLVILIDDRKFFLLNKGFNAVIPLPPPPKILLQKPHLCKAVLSSPPSSSSSSLVECTVVIKHYYAGVFYCRLGSDKSFTKLSNTPAIIWDILFYMGQLYVLCDPKHVVIFDHLLDKVSHVVTHMADVPTPRRLLISGNNILSIVAGWQPIRYSVFVFEGSEPRVVRVNNIGDNFQILLVNYYCTLSIRSTKEHKEFRRATEYFMDDFITLVLDTSKDPNKAKADDPWPLFFFMFSSNRIMK